jgi:hypothetical protein
MGGNLRRRKVSGASGHAKASIIVNLCEVSAGLVDFAEKPVLLAALFF